MEAIIIGGSAGAFDIILSILKGLDKHLDVPIIIVLHRLKNSDSSLEFLLQSATHYTVKEVEDKECMQKGFIYTVPSDYHLLLEENRRFSLDTSELVNYSRPSIDVTFESFSAVLKDKVWGILLSGANHDGAKGLKLIAENGGKTIVQDCNEAEFSTMPKSAVEIYKYHNILTHDNIIKLLNYEVI